MDKKIEKLIRSPQWNFQLESDAHNAEADAEEAGVEFSPLNYERGFVDGYSFALQSQAQEIERLRGNVLGVSADLEDCVEVAYNRGATEYVRLNYPEQYQRLNKNPKDT